MSHDQTLADRPVVSTLTLFGCTPLSPEMQVIHEAGEAMGGVNNIEDAQTIVLQGSGREYRLGQNKGPDDELPYWDSEDYVREIDLQNGRWRLSHRRTSAFLTGWPSITTTRCRWYSWPGRRVGRW